MKIQEVNERVEKKLKEYIKAKEQLREEFTSAQLKPKLQKLREEFVVEENLSSEILRAWADIEEQVTVEDVDETVMEIDSFFFGKSKEKGWKVLATTMNGENISFTAKYHSGAAKLNKGQQIIISGVFRFRASESGGYDYPWDKKISVLHEEGRPFTIKFRKC